MTHLLLPKQRAVARFKNMFGCMEWAGNMLRAYKCSRIIGKEDTVLFISLFFVVTQWLVKIKRINFLAFFRPYSFYSTFFT